MAPAGAEPRAAAHTLLLELAGTLVRAPRLSHSPDGQPLVPGLAVSVSHTHQLVAVVASYGGPLGVDLEEAYPREVQALARRWFTAEELAWTNRQPDELIAFLQLWTAKEAVGKALGRGLRGAGLRRAMPLGGGVVESEPHLLVTYVPWSGAVLALAAPVCLTEIVVHHESPVSPVAGFSRLGTAGPRDRRASPTLDPPCARG
ncbi:phosphopantetheinyl transferase [Kribbella pratensis]|uniref:Phosphopantetheinyl transferase n=1 Tax=Kribbella pratensis TaxID=2512112 RepID=A0A4R8BVJ6_9ACTN|nr:phosphopantetheinyl transferase [Kribbella pratensis]